MQHDQNGASTCLLAVQSAHKGVAWVTLPRRDSGIFIVYSEVLQRAESLAVSLPAEMLASRKIGLEKESLRVNASGGISQSDHPAALGSALTNPSITTDFSEALLEMVTPPCDSAADAMHYLTGIHQYIVQNLPDNEHIWNTSMPCILRGGQSVRIGEYGTSHSGRMKHAYRRGLGLRYGRRMQAIAGVHFNFSMPESSWHIRQALLRGQNPGALAASDGVGAQPVAGTDLRTRGYFEMMQNLLRVGWLVPYLFGSSPAICSSFLESGEGEELEIWNQTTRYAPYGTSLRMGKIGYRYRENVPIDLTVRHTSIEEYIKDITAHVSTIHPPYAAMGLHDEHGERQQLSAARLQIENEFYSMVRPKQIAKPGELPIHALCERGIRYLELRSVDVDVHEPVGVSLSQIVMLEMLMIFAWLAPPSPLSNEEMEVCSRNVKTVAHRGREPGLMLERMEGEVSLLRWGNEILDALQPIARWLDNADSSAVYESSLEGQRRKLHDPELTPSALMIKGIKQTGSFFEYVQNLSIEHDHRLSHLPQDVALQQSLADMVRESREKQLQLEAQSIGHFDDYLAAYLGQI